MSRSRLLARLKRIERQSRAPELPSRRPHSPPIEIKRLTSHFARQVEASGATLSTPEAQENCNPP